MEAAVAKKAVVTTVATVEATVGGDGTNTACGSPTQMQGAQGAIVGTVRLRVMVRASSAHARVLGVGRGRKAGQS